MIEANAVRKGNATGSILLVDDDFELLRAHERILSAAGFTLKTARNGLEAKTALRDKSYDVVVSDIAMPGADGIDVLYAAREKDKEVPVILMTAHPQVETAVLALQYGVFQYLLKPVRPEALVNVVRRAVKAQALNRLRRTITSELGQWADPGDKEKLAASFQRALETVYTAYQPVVSVAQREITAYEALLRTRDADLPNPLAMLRAAERLGRLNELGRVVRASVAEKIASTESNVDFLVNLHSQELLDETLYSPASPLTTYASRVIFEIAERAALDDVADARSRIERLRALGFRIAVDDLGQGHAGLTSFAILEPDMVKVDISLIRNLHLSAIQQRLVRAIVDIGRDLRLTVVAEGVETAEERDCLLAMGCQCQQGFFFGKPSPNLPAVTF